MPRKVSRNATCPCGSGWKYKRCCWNKDFKFVYGDDGEIYKRIPLSESGAEHVRTLIEMNEQGLAPSLEWITQAIPIAMAQAGVHPALIWAHMRTGLQLADTNYDKATTADVEEWEAAIREWEIETGETAPTDRLNAEDMLRMLMNGPPVVPGVPYCPAG